MSIYEYNEYGAFQQEYDGDVDGSAIERALFPSVVLYPYSYSQMANCAGLVSALVISYICSLCMLANHLV